VTAEIPCFRGKPATLYDAAMARLVLVHGSVGTGPRAWSAQRPLAERHELVVLERRGFPPGPDVERVDFEDEATWVAERTRPGDHLVGHSYGGVICLLAAVAQPELASLTVVEPPAFGVARGVPAVEEFVRAATALWDDGPDEPEAFLRAFLRLVGSRLDPPSPLPPDLAQGARTLMVERPPWEAEIPVAQLRALPFPKLVVSCGASAAFEAVCDVLERELGAERAVCPGAGHGVQGAPGFNDVLAAFVARAEAK
jgi:pimeloyl-ACP methyl ester carboxylesterase